MYLKDAENKTIEVEEIDGNKYLWKAITCKKLIEILEKLPSDYLLSCSSITRNIVVYDKELNYLSCIDIADEGYEKAEF